MELAGAAETQRSYKVIFTASKRNYASFILAMGQRRSFTALFRGFSRQGAAAGSGVGARPVDPMRDDPSADSTRVHPLRLPCRTCRRGSIWMLEPERWKRARRVPCPACAGTGYI